MPRRSLPHVHPEPPERLAAWAVRIAWGLVAGTAVLGVIWSLG